MMERIDQRQATMRWFAALYGLIVLVFIAIGPRVFASDWVSSSDFHACIEISSSFIALIAALGCLVYYFGQGSRYFLIIGLGFFICGSEDLVHGIFSFKRLFADSGVDFSRFIPGTYAAGRSVLAVMIIAAAVLEPLLGRFKRLRWEAGIFSGVALALGGGATALAFTLPLPQFIYPEQTISRPVDFISALLYAAAFAVILKRFLSHRDVFTGSLLACVLLNLGGQVYMSFSKQLFDVFFDVAHWANILSYCVPVAGITLEALGRMKTAEREIAERKRAEQELRQSSALLKASNMELEAHRAQMEAQRQDLETTNLQLRESRIAAETANREKSRFLANMSHEIRTPMTAVIGYADLLSRSSGRLPGDCGSWVVQIRQNANHLVSLINDILDLSKIEAGQMQLNWEECDIVAILAEVDSMLRPAAVEKLLQFRVLYGGTLPETIRTDPLRLRQILLNLVSNAFKFTDQGRVTVNMDCTEANPTTGQRHLRISVEDTGIGIAADDLETLFHPFVQGRHEAAGDRGGTGLGLDISRRLAQLLGGDITATSERGVGSTFVLELSLADDVKIVSVDDVCIAAARKNRQDRVPQSVDLRNMRILIVDDNPDNQVIIAFLLQEAGASIDLANDGAAGVQAVIDAEEANTSYDAILMDMRMPVMDGYAATAALRERGFAVPIIALTAHAMVGDEEKCRVAGCDAYVSKPVVPDQLFRAIQQLVDGAADGASSQEDNRSAPLMSTMIDNPRFASVLRKYLNSLPSVIAELEVARDAEDAEELCAIVHRLHGTATNYGFPSVSERAGVCEQTLREAGSLQAVDEPLARLSNELKAACAGAAESIGSTHITSRDT